jgi:EpsI family protein
MLSRIAIFVPAFLAVQTGVTFWAGQGERIPPKPQFARFPLALGEWKKTGDDPISAETLEQLKADSTFSEIYSNSGSDKAADNAPGEAWMGSVFVAWFQSQRGGASQPHSPQVCLPASGWVPSTADRVAMQTSAGPVPINRYIASFGSGKVVVLYWYQTRARVIASEWAAKFWVIADRLKEQRTDTSLVRIVVWNSARSDAETTAQALDLAERTYPELTGLFAR